MLQQGPGASPPRKRQKRPHCPRAPQSQPAPVPVPVPGHRSNNLPSIFSPSKVLCWLGVRCCRPQYRRRLLVLTRPLISPYTLSLPLPYSFLFVFCFPFSLKEEELRLQLRVFGTREKLKAVLFWQTALHSQSSLALTRVAIVSSRRPQQRPQSRPGHGPLRPHPDEFKG